LIPTYTLPAICASGSPSLLLNVWVNANTVCRRWGTLTYCCYLHTSDANATSDPRYTSGGLYNGTDVGVPDPTAWVRYY
jgi:hypothetical protein